MSFIYDEILLAFHDACKNNNLSLAQKLLNEFPDTIRHHIYDCNNLEFSVACQNNQLEVIKFLLSKFGFNEKLVKDLPHYWLFVCEKESLTIVEYLSQFVKIYKDDNFHRTSIKALERATTYDAVKIVEYLLTKYSTIDNLQPYVGQIFVNAVNNGSDKVIDYLLLHYDFSLTDTLTNLLQQKNRLDILKKLEAKKLYKSLHKNLKNINENKISKNKI